ncbi:MAG: hypothetical protein ABI867_18090 [Kofleriaceae bacterium]
MRFSAVLIFVCCASVAAAGPTDRKSPSAKASVKVAAKKKKKAKTRKPARKQHQRADLGTYERPPDYASAPAYRYSTMTADACYAELAARKLPAHKEAVTKGVLAPVRLTGELHGVTFRTNLKDAQRATTPWEIADCRLVLALDDFSQVLEAHGIVDVRHYSMYRSPGASWPEGDIGKRHNGALAIDAARFIRKDGTYVDVDKHFNGAIGAKACGDGAGPHPATADAIELRAILCETVAKRIFNFHLTPNYNRPHKNHFHLEVTAGFKAFTVQ